MTRAGEEYRRAKRRRAQEPIDVFDTMAEQTIGRIGNLSETGMMLLVTREMLDDALFQLRFVLPHGASGGRRIEVGAHQLWSEEASSPGQFWCGFRFIDIAPDDLDLLRLWVDAPGGEYA
ncbi:MAG: PilZ domain-containing protein [Lysobacteraceae bacterium]